MLERFRNMIRIATAVLLVGWLCIPAGAADGDLAPELPDPSVKRFALEVGTARISEQQIFEVWGPVWYDTIARTHAGKITPGECDRVLQEEWSRALETVAREEMFYQEADREFDQMIAKRAQMMFEQQTGRRSSPESYMSEQRIEKELRHLYNKEVERQLTDFVDRYIRAAGGLEQLKKVISGRGLNWIEWRERLRKKAFTEQYLRTVLGPRVPRHPRPADIRAYYREHKDEFLEPGAVSFRHILFAFDKRGGEEAARTAAINVYDAIADGRFTFEEAARRFSDDSLSKERGGLETEISPDPDREAWLSDIRNAAREETPGELGSILLSTAGAHLVQLVKTQPGTPVPFADAQRQIKERLYSAKWEEEVQAHYETLKTKVRIRILMPEFPAAYRWAAIARPGVTRPERRIGPTALPSVKTDEE